MSAATWNGISFPFSCAVEGGPYPIEGKEIAFPGVDGEAEMDMGKRSRTFTISGRLVDAVGGTPSAETLLKIDSGKVATLAAGGISFPNCRVLGERTRIFDWATAIFDGTAKRTCKYEITFKQYLG